MLVHRVVFREAYGRPVKDGLVVMHTCDHPACVNPNHLLEGTRSDNQRDCWSKNRSNWQAIPIKRKFGKENHNGRKTKCKFGHPFDAANTDLRANGGRRCRECHRQDSRRRYHGPQGQMASTADIEAFK